MKPDYLTKKSHIYFVAPSFGEAYSPYKERFDRSKENLSKLGFKLTTGFNCYRGDGIAASAPAIDRGKEFMEAYESDCDAIISVGGGETMCEMLPYVDFDRIKELKPKWFVGFSDNTNLTYTLTTICDIETIYGSGGASFYMYPFKYEVKDTYDMLLGRKKVFYGYKSWCDTKSAVTYPDYYFNKRKKITPINYNNPFKGRIIGGCLDILVTISGTRFDKTKEYIERHKDEGIIFFMEACDLLSVGIRRALFQLKESGWFDKYVKGFVIGRTMHYDDKSFGTTPNDAYIDLLKDFNVPILLNCDIGHLDPSMPIRCGGLATVEFDGKNIKIEYED